MRIMHKHALKQCSLFGKVVSLTIAHTPPRQIRAFSSPDSHA
jgi:hypothetical protein